MHVPVSLSVLLSCYIVIRDAGYHFDIIFILVLPIVPVAHKLAVGNFKEKKMDEINPLSKFLSLIISFICGENTASVPGIICGIICGSFLVLGLFAIQFGDHLRARAVTLLHCKQALSKWSMATKGLN